MPADVKFNFTSLPTAPMSALRSDTIYRVIDISTFLMKLTKIFFVNVGLFKNICE